MSETKPGLSSLYDPWRLGIQGEIRTVRTAIVREYTRGPPCKATVELLVAEREVLADGSSRWLTAPPVTLPVRWMATAGFSLAGDLHPGDLVEVHFRDVPHGEVNSGNVEPGIEPVSASRWNIADAWVVALSQAIDPAAVSSAGPVLWMRGGDTLMIGSAGATFVPARADLVEDELTAIKTTLDSLTGGAMAPAEFGTPYTGPGSVGSDRIKVDG